MYFFTIQPVDRSLSYYCISGSTASNIFRLSKVLGGGDSVAVSCIRLYIHVGQSLLGSCYLCIDMSRRARGACTPSSVHTGWGLAYI